jgi:hypothetical protein
LPPPLPETRWALTPPFHPGLPRLLPDEAGGLSLLHFPSRSRDRALPGIVLSGARTFLPPCFAPLGFRLSAWASRSWFTTGDHLYGIDDGQGDTGMAPPQWVRQLEAPGSSGGRGRVSNPHGGGARALRTNSRSQRQVPDTESGKAVVPSFSSPRNQHAFALSSCCCQRSSHRRALGLGALWRAGQRRRLRSRRHGVQRR